jgi:hypothetical protein
MVVRFEARLGWGWVRGVAAASLLLSTAPELASESVNLSTYYPSPSGVYASMLTTGDTYLSRDGGAVMVGSTATATAYYLDVYGSLHAAGAGTFRVASVGSPAGTAPLTVNGSAVIQGALNLNAPAASTSTVVGGINARSLTVGGDVHVAGDVSVGGGGLYVGAGGAGTGRAQDWCTPDHGCLSGMTAPLAANVVDAVAIPAAWSTNGQAWWYVDNNHVLHIDPPNTWILTPSADCPPNYTCEFNPRTFQTRITAPLDMFQGSFTQTNDGTRCVHQNWLTGQCELGGNGGCPNGAYTTGHAMLTLNAGGSGNPVDEGLYFCDGVWPPP